ncbi:MAG: DPP IV N-terminal domain-containing protein [Acidobacteriota bacterium]|nr:DPP IV N-terminal domain-containing protein [Acidobacteriota bacterium]
MLSHSHNIVRTLVVSAAVVVYMAIGAAAPVLAQQAYAPDSLSAADYDRAEGFLGNNLGSLILHSGVSPNWLPGGRFWYRVATAAGDEFILVDPERGTREPAFDHARLAEALSEASSQLAPEAASNVIYEAYGLPFTRFEFDANTIRFTAGGRGWACNTQNYRCTPAGAVTDDGRQGRGGRGNSGRMPTVLSPDGTRAVFIRDENLWVRAVATGAEQPLTRDGIKDYGYATDNAGWRKSDRPVVLWSPDSNKIATFQQDQRGVGEMYLTDTRPGHPSLEAWKYPLPGDSVITVVERVVINLQDGTLVRLQMPPDQHRSSRCDDIICGGSWGDVQWSPDSSSMAFLSTSRDHKQEWLRIADISSGKVRTVLKESVPTFFESGNGAINWRYLPGSGEFIWFSERDDWGHLYLYDLETGGLKNQITLGEGNVTRILRLDKKERQIYFLGVGFEGERDPYFQHFYRVGFDGRGMTLLTPENANHNITLSPSGGHFVDNFSTPDTPPVAVLRDSEGAKLVDLESADISRLLAAGWHPPEPFTVKARDGKTDLYGLMFKPTNLDPNRKYPIINSIYPGPQTGSVGSRNFSVARGDTQAIAELGFIVIKLDGMGTPWRSKSFHEAYYGDMGDNTLPDQVTGMQQLAERYPWVDIDRVGIYGHSGGGYATTGAMFHYPDFFKVGVSQAGNHDNRVYEDDWGEKWQGLLVRDAAGGTNYDNQANQNFAHNLKGKLLLAHGTMDTNVPFYSTLLVVDALIEANKNFDFILFPNRGHGFGNEPYMMRRRWDYFVEHLLGATPPHDYQMRRSR